MASETPYLSKTPLQDLTCEKATVLIKESAAVCIDLGFPGIGVHKVSNPTSGVMSIYCAGIDAMIESTKQVVDRSECQSYLSSDCSFAIGDEPNTWAVYDSCLLLLDSPKRTAAVPRQSTTGEEETTEEEEDGQSTSISYQSTGEEEKEDAVSDFFEGCSLQEPWNVVVGYVTTDLYTPPLIDASLALSLGSELGNNSRFQYVPNIQSLSMDIPIDEYLKAYAGLPSDENTLSGALLEELQRRSSVWMEASVDVNDQNTLSGALLEELQRRSSVWMEASVDVNDREAEMGGVEAVFLHRMNP
eukprot:GHVH01014690.1.p1 GENE.GHVH01014690.1~~GHVH01014690.1.p1  ORF type:complete len:302 (+),score=43.58 GHVH01014690.1:1423-2328(+)